MQNHKPRPAASIGSRTKAPGVGLRGLAQPPCGLIPGPGSRAAASAPPPHPPGHAAAARAHNSRGGASCGVNMAAPQPCAEGPCCSWPGAASGVQQTLDEMDFDRGETPGSLQVSGQGDGREAGT